MKMKSPVVEESVVFNPVRYAVPCMEKPLFSRYSGEYRGCLCGAVAVDQTEYYSRILGDFKHLTKLDDNDRS